MNKYRGDTCLNTATEAELQSNRGIKIDSTMKKKHFIIILICGLLFGLFIFGAVFGSFDFTYSKRLGKTNYYLIENPSSVGLYYQYPDMKDSFVGVLEGRIIDVYWNEQYILATPYAVNKDSITGYYIVKMLLPVKKGVPWEKTKLSTKEEYEQKKQELLLNEKEMKHTIY